MSRLARDILTHGGAVARLTVGVTPAWLHVSGLVILGMGLVMGCRDLLQDRTGALAGGLALLLWMVPTSLRASWIGGSDAEQPLLPMGRRTAAVVEGTFILLTLVPGALLLTWALSLFDASHVGGEGLAPSAYDLARTFVLVWPFLVGCCLPRRALGEDALATTLPPALVLAMAAWIPSPTVSDANLLATWPGVLLTAAAMSGVLALELPLRLARRATSWVERRRRFMGALKVRPGLPGSQRLSADLRSGVIRGLMALCVAMGLLALAFSLLLPRWLSQGLAIAAVPVVFWGFFTPLALPLTASLSTLENGGTPWEILPVPRGATLRATWLHHLWVGLGITVPALVGVAALAALDREPLFHSTLGPFLLFPLGATFHMLWDSRSNPVRETVVLAVVSGALFLLVGPWVDHAMAFHPIGHCGITALACAALWLLGHLWTLRRARGFGRG